MLDHPNTEELASLLHKCGSPPLDRRLSRITRHLLAQCETCRHRLRRAAAARAESLRDYGSAFAAVEGAVADFLAVGTPPAAPVEALLAELLMLDEAEQRQRVAELSRFAHPALVERLIDESHARRYDSPALMLRLANLARLAAARCSAAMAGSAARLTDLLARSWREYGNALRVSGRLGEAGEALTTARLLAEQGTGDPALRASIFEQIASLRIFERRFEEADELAAEAGRWYREMGDRRSQASTMVQRAIAAIYAGNVETAMRLLSRAIAWIDGPRDPYLLLAACHNLVRCYIDLGHPKEALAVYTQLRDLYCDLHDPLIVLRASWQQGQLLRDLGSLHAAEAALLLALEGFAERGLFYEAAVISLDLAGVYVRLGARQKLERTVSNSVPIFRALGVDREALAALLQLRQLADQEEQALELIQLLDFRLAGLEDRPAVG